MYAKRMGLDLAKDVFQVHGVTTDGDVAFNRSVRRLQLLAFFEKVPPWQGPGPRVHHPVHPAPATRPLRAQGPGRGP